MKSLIFLFLLSACSISQKNIPSTTEANSSKSDSIMNNEDQYKEKLSKEEYQVLRLSGTEAPFSGKFYEFDEPGKYYCKACNNYLFSSKQKFNSSCGWPSFYDINKEGVKYIQDKSHGMIRTEVRCAKCDSHLGHVFEDGPKEKTGLRYCINSVCLTFEPEK